MVFDYVRAHPGSFGLDESDLDGMRLQARYRTSDGVTHLRWAQMLGGVRSFDSGLIAHVADDGRLVAISGGAVPDLEVADTKPAITPGAALAAAREDVGGALVAPRADTTGGAERETSFAGGDRAELRIFPTADGARLAWWLLVTGDEGRLYATLRDADTNALLLRQNLTNDASIKAFPRAPGASPGGTHETFGIGGGANPTGDATWLDDTAGGTRLKGNNAHAYPDEVADDAPDSEIAATNPATLDWLQNQTAVPAGTPCPGPAPDIGASSCTWNSADLSSRSINRVQATTNLFFHTNRFHDHLLDPNIGFTEAAGNFERVNASGQGSGNDAVLAESNDGSGLDNANFATPPDGFAPRMQMFLRTQRDVNGSDDASVMYHEYTHGFSNRTVVNASGASTLSSVQPRGMGEGWSDWYALDYLVASGLYTDTAADGEVFLNQYSWGGTGTRSEGIDCPVGATAPTCQASGSGGYTYGDVASRLAAANPHGIGEIFAQTIWDLRKDVGSATARKLVSGGMRLSAPNPSLLDMRNAILLQAAILGGGLYDKVWTAYANRGMGFGATGSATATSAVDNFTLPPPLAPAQISAQFSDPFPAGDNDGILEAGETVKLTETIVNPSATALTNVSGALSGPAGITAPAVAWPSPFGTDQPAARDFAITLGPATCDQSPAIGLAITSTGGGTLNVPLTPRIGGPKANHQSADVPKAIPDGIAAGIDSVLNLPAGSGAISDIDVTIDRINHTWVSDLRLQLTHDPDGPGGVAAVSRILANGAGGDGNNFVGTVFDDEAATPILSGLAPFSGFFKPTQTLSGFDGRDRGGTWTLNVRDAATPDPGTLVGWGIDKGGSGCDVTIPEATTGAAAANSNAALLAGTVNPHRKATGFRFAYGTTTAYGAHTAAGDAGAVDSAVSVQGVVGGLAPSTTYHYRLESLRDGQPAILGADATFTTAATPPPGVTPKPPVKPVVKVVPKILFPKTTSYTLSRTGVLTFSFTGTPGLKGSAVFESLLSYASVAAKKKKAVKRKLKLGTRTFTVGRTGRVKVSLKLSKANLAKVKKLRRLRARSTVKLGGVTFRKTFTLNAPKVVRKRR